MLDTTQREYVLAFVRYCIALTEAGFEVRRITMADNGSFAWEVHSHAGPVDDSRIYDEHFRAADLALACGIPPAGAPASKTL